MRIGAYLLTTAAGVALFFQVDSFHLPSHSALPWHLLSVVLALGGVIALVGQLLRRWPGEYVGLPLLGAALIGFGVLQANVAGWNVTVVPSVALLWAFALKVGARWRDVNLLYRAARNGAR